MLPSQNNFSPYFSQQTSIMLFFARQPIFTVRGILYGYELLFRDQSNLTAANIQDSSQATSEIIVDGISFASAHSGTRTKVFINIPDELLRSEILESLSPDMCILEILETVPCTRENIAVLRHLKSLGYTLALDDYRGQRGVEGFLDLVDIVKVDFQSAPARRLAGISEGLRKRGVTMLAEKVESYQEAEWAGNAGYELLQGFYFQRPELISAKRLTPDAHTKLRILYYLASGRMERKELFALLSYSPQLAFRLLNFVNSVAFSFREKIDSIKTGHRAHGRGPATPLAFGHAHRRSEPHFRHRAGTVHTVRLPRAFPARYSRLQRLPLCRAAFRAGAFFHFGRHAPHILRESF